VRLEGVQSDGEPSAQCLLAIIDLSELNQLQRRSQHAHKLEILGTLSGGVAHDFNNLLAAVLSWADAALTRLRPEDSAREPLEQLSAVVLRGRSVVDRILRFARPDRPEVASVQLDPAVEAAARLLGRLLGSEVRLELDLRAGDARIHIDRGQLDQILFNLATNASHAMPAGGRLRIESRVIAPNALHSASSAEPGQQPRVLLAVSDTGLGMDEETRARAFQPFFTTKRPSSGTGLGLSMIRDVMAQAGGHVELQSAPGRGTTVFLYWPRSEDEPRLATPLAPRPEKALRTRRAVLLVDDDRLVRTAMRRYLEQAGWDVVEAEAGDAAIELLRQAPARFELLVTDVLLPGQTGSDLARAALQIRPGLGALFVSGHTRAELLERGWLESDAVLLNKPFTAAELQLALRQVLGDSGARAFALNPEKPLES
jgi:nitrogen-specific signal transduction histidine kinase/ActR/RegA family two-component response regulator